MAYHVADFLIALITIIGSALLFAIWRNSYFDRRGMKLNIRPLPFFGNFFQIFIGKDHLTEVLLKFYNASQGQRYSGFFSFMTPTILIRDLDLIKKIGVKDFDHFVDHKVFLDEKAEPLLGSNLFFLRGQKWRDMRATLSPAFTGSKMKAMYPLITECSEQYRDYLMEETKDVQGEIKEIEMKEAMTRFTNDVIASTAFGFKINSFSEKNNKFYVMGKVATNFSGWQYIKFQAYAFIPSIMKKLKLTLFSSSVIKFFSNIVHNTIKNREKNGLIRNDMIHLLMLAKKGSLQSDGENGQTEDSRFSNIQGSIINKQESVKREWSDDEITAQAMAFIVAGFGTPSALLCFIAYELATHPEIQQKLHYEIDEVYKKTKGQPTFLDLQTMKYIDMVISETLRLWPPDGLLERVCVKPYTLPPQNEKCNKNYEVKVKDEFIIPIFAIHRDPEYYPEPEKFDPERFSDENKHLIKPFTYIPFGVGPRLCIGARFALMEAKSAMFHMLAHFELSTTSKTPIPFVLAKDTFNMHPVNGLWLGVKRRKINS